jgi:hypothetical protein
MANRHVKAHVGLISECIVLLKKYQMVEGFRYSPLMVRDRGGERRGSGVEWERL